MVDIHPAGGTVAKAQFVGHGDVASGDGIHVVGDDGHHALDDLEGVLAGDVPVGASGSGQIEAVDELLAEDDAGHGVDDAGQLEVEEPEVLARLLIGALTRGAMLIAGSPEPLVTRDAVSKTVRHMLHGLR